jgi:GTP cyclohydrolase I
MEDAVKQILIEIGENPEREGLIKTPNRYAKALEFLTQGYKQDLDTIINEAIFHEETEEMVIVKSINFFSLCEHHMLPFMGTCHIAYMPNKKIIGLSKIARIVDLFSRRLQVLKRLTQQIAQAIENILKPKGVAVIMEGTHLCMAMRGVEKVGSNTVTRTFLGDLKNKINQDYFLKMIQ